MHKYRISHLIIGGYISLFSIWIIGIFFCRNYVPIEYCDELERNIYKPGISILSTKEGYALTKCGKSGIIAPLDKPDIISDAVLLMGNSFAEGLHVPDYYKMHQIANKELLSNKYESLQIYNVAMSSQLFCDTLWQIPKYLKYYRCIKGIVVIVMSHDLLPTSKSSQYGSSIVNDNGNYAILPPPPNLITKFGIIKYKFHLNAFLALAKGLQNSFFDWKSRVFSQPLKQNINNVELAKKNFENQDIDEYLDFQLSKLRSTTNLPILILCCIDKPIRTSQGIKNINVDSILTQKVKYYSKKNNIDFYTMREDFNQLNDNNLIVCGFSNTLPGDGHFSIYAHQAIGEKISNWCLNTIIIKEAKK